jgi:hypothetical protein
MAETFYVLIGALIGWRLCQVASKPQPPQPNLPLTDDLVRAISALRTAALTLQAAIEKRWEDGARRVELQDETDAAEKPTQH